MTVIRLPDLRDRPPPGHAVAGWYALTTDHVSVPTLGEARRCAELGFSHDPCTLRVVATDPQDGAVIIAVPDGHLSVDIDVLPEVPPDTAPVLIVRAPPDSEDILAELTGEVIGPCRTRAHFEPDVPGDAFGYTYGVELVFRGAGGDIAPVDNVFEVTLVAAPAPVLAHDPCAITLAPAVLVVLPVMDPALRRPPQPPLLALTGDGCEVAAWSTHPRGFVVVPAGPDGVDVWTSACGGVAFHLGFAGAEVRDAIFWSDTVAVLFADHVALFDFRGCRIADPFAAVDGGFALGVSDAGALLVVSRTDAAPDGSVRVFRHDGSELAAPGAFDARGWYARRRSAGFVYDEVHCEYLLDGAQVAAGCCIASPRVLSDDESLFFRYVDDLRTLRGRPAYARQGEVVIGPDDVEQPLDAGRPGTQWHRVALLGEIPAGCVVEIRTRATDDLLAADPLLPDGWSDPVEATPLSRVAVEPPDDDREAAADAMVLAGPGRFLEVKLTLLGDGRRSPRIIGIEIEQPREGISQYLPQVFRDSTPDDDFLRRWLALFEQAALRGVADRMDDYAGLFDPHTAPEDFLEYVAGWLEILSLDRFRTDVDAFRRILIAAPELAKTRGTPAGLELAVKLYMGISIQVVEAIRTGSEFLLGTGATVEAADCSAVTGAVLGCQTILSREPSPIDLGDEPRLGCGFLLECDDRAGYFPWHFDVWVPARCVCRSEDRALLDYIIQVEKPAHTTYRIRETGAAGWVLGVESVVGQDQTADFDRDERDPATFGITLLNGPPRASPLGTGLVLGRDSRLVGAASPPGALYGNIVGVSTRIGA